MFRKDLKETEYHSYHKTYLDLAPELTLLEALKHSEEEVLNFITSVPIEKHAYSYAPGKWNLKEIFSHIIDTERIFVYRALRIARMDESSLLGYDHEEFVKTSGAASRSTESLIQEYEAQRSSTIIFFKNLEEEMLLKIGKANEQSLSPRAIAFILCGHEKHHLNVFEERYT